MPAGRPSKIAAQLRLPNGQTTTVQARIVELIRHGAFVERAAKSAGIAKGTLYGWLEVAGHAQQALAAGRTLERLTAHQRACLAFSDAVDEAEATYEMQALVSLSRLEAGIAREIVTEKYIHNPTNGEEVLIERTVRRETGVPSAAAITWKLTRRFPERYQLQHDAGAATGMPDPGDTSLTEQSITETMADVERFLSEVAD